MCLRCKGDCKHALQLSCWLVGSHHRACLYLLVMLTLLELYWCEPACKHGGKYCCQDNNNNVEVCELNLGHIEWLTSDFTLAMHLHALGSSLSDAQFCVRASLA
ncbi:unnamed protein product [Ixodes pacificus]